MTSPTDTTQTTDSADLRRKLTGAQPTGVYAQRLADALAAKAEQERSAA